MQIKYLQLSNIRSYGEKTTIIPFTLGLTLFEGNIGSGKSTILTAIEFGLFGLGDLDAHHLLRHGAKKGDVALTFEAGGRDYTVRRSLIKSGRGIKQNTCTLEQDDGISEYSPSEIRPVILEILGFNEKPDPKATSRIFRYAVYTPQESMKEILNMKEDARMDILRRAFGIEQYRWAVNNANTILIKSWINPEIRYLDDVLSKASDVEEEYERYCGEKEEIGRRLKEKETEKNRLLEKIKAIESEIQQLEPRKKQLLKLSGEIDPLEREYGNIQDQIRGIEKSLVILQQEIADIESREKELISISALHNEYQDKKKQREKLVPVIDDQKDLEKQKVKSEGKIDSEKNSLENRLEELENQYKTKPDVELNTLTLKEEKKTLEAEKEKESQLTAALNTLNEQVKKLGPERDTLNSLKGEIPGLERECKGLEKQLSGLEKSARKLKSALDTIKTKEKMLIELAPQYQEYLNVKQEIGSLEGNADRHHGLDKERERLKTLIDNETKNLDKTITRLQEESDKYPATLKKIKDLEEEQQKLENLRESLGKSLKEYTSIQEEIADLKKKKENHETVIHVKNEETKKLKNEWKKIDSINVGAKCPRCQQVLTEEHLKTVGKEYAAEIAGIESIQEKEQAEIGQISQQLDELTKKLESYSDCEEQIRINNKRLAEIPAELKNDRKEKKKLENLLHELKLAMEMRDKKTVASEEQVQLKQVENELTLISPVMKKLSDLKDKLGTIEAADIPTKYNNITGEISQKDGVLAQITDNESQTKTAEEKLKQFQNELKQKQEQLEQGSEIFIKITDCELQKKEITKELENLRKKLIRLDQIPIELDNLGKELKKLDETKTEIDNLSNNLQKNQYALEERRTLESILANMEKLKPDIDKYSELTSRIEELETEDIVSKYSECNTEIRRKPIIIKKIGEDQKKLKDTETLLHRKDEEIQKKKKILDEGKSVFERLDSLEKRRGNEQEALGDCRESIAASISQLNGVEEKIQKINVEIKEFQKTAKSVCILEETKRWLANDLVPAINTIEKQVLANINEQFNAVFQRSFGMLIENEDISVSVNESFTPILEQDGYEIDVSALSGGEKTSVALAYRLALNTIVKQQIPSLKSSLLILDEPTDGFSSSQLYKLRDILRDTRCEQVIMVSHENELEGFVDSIYRVSKENGVSTVKA